MSKALDFCARCDMKLEDGVTRCPGCGAILTRPGSFTELVGWVIAVGSLVPIVIGIKVVDQHYYVPLIGGVILLVIGFFFAFYGRLQKSGVTNPVKTRQQETERNAETAPKP